MKVFVAILLVANLALAAWIAADARRPAPAVPLMHTQLNADRIRIVRDGDEPVALVPIADACIEWSPFPPDELARARTMLGDAGFGERLFTASISGTAGWWVFIPPQVSRDAAERKVAELRKLGIADAYLVQDHGEWENAISLGIFRNDEGARRFVEQLHAKGVRSAISGARSQQVRQTGFYLRQPVATDARALEVLGERFPGTTVKTVRCPQ